jgi:hypothetical protein
VSGCLAPGGSPPTEPATPQCDVPAKLAARVRLFDAGRNRKTAARDAHSIAVVAVRTKTLRVLQLDAELEALRMLVDRRTARPLFVAEAIGSQNWSDVFCANDRALPVDIGKAGRLNETSAVAQLRPRDPSRTCIAIAAPRTAARA